MCEHPTRSEVWRQIARYLQCRLDETGPILEVGGLHVTKPGGHLNVHADFTVHPRKRRWRRRVNLLLFLNPDWHERYEGHLELWSDLRLAAGFGPVGGDHPGQ